MDRRALSLMRASLPGARPKPVLCKDVRARSGTPYRYLREQFGSTPAPLAGPSATGPDRLALASMESFDHCETSPDPEDGSGRRHALGRTAVPFTNATRAEVDDSSSPKGTGPDFFANPNLTASESAGDDLVTLSQEPERERRRLRDCIRVRHLR